MKHSIEYIAFYTIPPHCFHHLSFFRFIHNILFTLLELPLLICSSLNGSLAGFTLSYSLYRWQSDSLAEEGWIQEQRPTSTSATWMEGTWVRKQKTDSSQVRKQELGAEIKMHLGPGTLMWDLTIPGNIRTAQCLTVLILLTTLIIHFRIVQQKTRKT